MFLDYVALAMMIFVAVTLMYAIIAIHDIPYDIAKSRQHPHQDAIHAAGWVSLATMHAMWPFLWIWAMTFRPDRGWGFSTAPSDSASSPGIGIEDIETRLAALEQKLAAGRTD